MDKRGCPRFQRALDSLLAMLKNGFFDAVLLLSRKRYRGIVEITTDEETPADVADAWQALFPPPENAHSGNLARLEHWDRLEGKPKELPSRPRPALRLRAVRVWTSDRI
jgi:DNA-directed RNA polymerase specialized sigma24 family protein